MLFVNPVAHIAPVNAYCERVRRRRQQLPIAGLALDKTCLFLAQLRFKSFGCGSSGIKTLSREDKELRQVGVLKEGASRVDWWWISPLAISPEDPEDARHRSRYTGSV